jgi:hypothetical protein
MNTNVQTPNVGALQMGPKTPTDNYSEIGCSDFDYISLIYGGGIPK